MKKLENILQVFNITEKEACLIICKHAYKGKAGRKLSIFKLDLSRQVKIIMDKKKGRSLNEAITIFHRKYFKEFQQEWNVDGKVVVKNLTEVRIRKIINEIQNLAYEKKGIMGVLPSEFVIPKKKVGRK